MVKTVSILQSVVDVKNTRCILDIQGLRAAVTASVEGIAMGEWTKDAHCKKEMVVKVYVWS